MATAARVSAPQHFTLSPPLVSAMASIDSPLVSSCVVRKPLTTARIKDVVAGFYDLTPGWLTGPCRKRQFARPRQVAMYLSRQLTGKSFPDIGRLFGGRDHTTVIHAVRQVERLMQIDGDFAADVEVLRERLR